MLTSGRAMLVGELVRALLVDMTATNDDVARNASDAVATVAIFGEAVERADSGVAIWIAEALR